ncbi:MAG TPA: response regulator [candidate division Zixibacteria bacterium]|nr:response regulator [candidate division Zixibacteria bacterium]
MNYKPIKILLVEDNPADIRLATEALKEGGVVSDLSVVTDGMDAINFLKRTGKYSDSPRPELILLDLNLPRKNGFDVLQVLKADPNLKSIPVIMLTTSSAEEDIVKSYNLNANCFVTKPTDLEQFLEVVKTIEEFWLTIASLPVLTGKA